MYGDLPELAATPDLALMPTLVMHVRTVLTVLYDRLLKTVCNGGRVDIAGKKRDGSPAESSC